MRRSLFTLMVFLVTSSFFFSLAPKVRASGSGIMVGGFGTETLVNPLGTDVNVEPSIAIDNAGQHLVAAYMDTTPTSSQCYSMRSAGSPALGLSWGSSQLQGGNQCSDPVVRFGSDGVAHLIVIIAPNDYPGYFWISHVSSSDGGVTWNLAHKVVDAGTTSNGGCGEQLDKPWLAIDPYNANNLFVSYTVITPSNLIKPSSTCPLGSYIELASSTDGGTTWTRKAVTSWNYVDGTSGSSIAVAPNGSGDVLVAWFVEPGFLLGSGQMSIQLRKLLNYANGGTSMSSPITVATGYQTPMQLCGFKWRLWATMFPHLISDNIYYNPSGTYNMFVVYGARPAAVPSGNCVQNSGTDDADVYFASSFNSGNSWNQPIDLTPGGSTASNNPDQFFPALGLDGQGGLHVTYADMRTDSTQYKRFQVMQEQSYNAGSSWTTPIPVASQMAYSSVNFIGDYFDIATTGSIIIPIWTDLRTESTCSTSGCADIYTAVSYPPPPQNDCGSGSDAGGSFSTATGISPPVTCTGYLNSGYDLEDWYQFNVGSIPSSIAVTLTPPSGSDFQLNTYDPGGLLNTKASSYSLTACVTGSWRLQVYTASSMGTYTLSLAVTPNGGSCSGGGGGSVAYGSLITLANGSRIPVQNLWVGAQMLGYNTATGQFTASTVLSIRAVNTTNMLIINTASGIPFRVDANPRQTLWTKISNGTMLWLPVTLIEPGDYLFTPKGWTLVTGVQYAPSGQHTMFDIIASMPYFADNYLDPVYKQ